MKFLQHIAVFIFLAAIIILTIVSLAVVWELLEEAEEVIAKSFLTFFVLIITAGIILVAGKAVRKNEEEVGGEVSAKFVSGLRKIRRAVSGIIIIASILLAFVAIFTAWEIIEEEGEMLLKSLSSLGILAVSGFVIGVTCLMGEKKLDIFAEREKGLSIWKILAMLIIVLFLYSVFSMLTSLFFFSSPYFY